MSLIGAAGSLSLFRYARSGSAAATPSSPQRAHVKKCVQPSTAAPTSAASASASHTRAHSASAQYDHMPSPLEFNFSSSPGLAQLDELELSPASSPTSSPSLRAQCGDSDTERASVPRLSLGADAASASRSSRPRQRRSSSGSRTSRSGSGSGSIGKRNALPSAFVLAAYAAVACLFLGSPSPLLPLRGVRANTALPADYAPLNYGLCTRAPVNVDEAPAASTGAYGQANFDQFIAESVNLPDLNVNGDSCGYAFPPPDGLDPVRNLTARFFGAGFHAAASQDLFNGMQLPEDISDLRQVCTDYTMFEGNATAGNQCAQMCGVCVLVTGTNGTQLYTVNELATIERFSFTGRGLSLHLGQAQPVTIRETDDPRKDVQFVRVPCPVDGPMYLIVRTSGSSTQAMFTPVNHRYGIRSMFIDRNGTWIALPRSYANEFQFDSDTFSWQEGDVLENTTEPFVRLRVVSQVAGLSLVPADGPAESEIVCERVAVNPLTDGVELVECRSAEDGPVQFAEACVNENACDFTNDEERVSSCLPPATVAPPSPGGGADPAGSDEGGLSPGAIGGTVAGILVVLIAGAFVGVFVRRRRRGSGSSGGNRRYDFQANAHNNAPGPDPFGTVQTKDVRPENDMTSPYGSYGEPYDTAFVGATTRAP